MTACPGITPRRAALPSGVTSDTTMPVNPSCSGVADRTFIPMSTVPSHEHDEARHERHEEHGDGGDLPGLGAQSVEQVIHGPDDSSGSSAAGYVSSRNGGP